MLGLLSKVFGDSNEKVVKNLQPVVAAINKLEPEFEKLSDEALAAKTAEFKSRLAKGEELDDLLEEAFAAVREASKRTLKQRHFDVQLMGGVVLHSGKIAEMKTGEGKTLVATLPAYLNALRGKGIHVVTVNDYLAKRDCRWMGQIYRKLGLSTACLQHESSYLYDPSFPQASESMKDMRPISRQEAYAADITYGTNHEFGFDYLRDNMVVDLNQCVQRELPFAIVDEVDNILIDEARTPLIISGQSQESTDVYYNMARVAPNLVEDEDYKIDLKQKQAALTEDGVKKVEKLLNIKNLYDPEHYNLTHYVENALRAQVLYKRDREYVVKDGEVIIVDEFTGRLMTGRRWADGIHQAVEAKEGVKIQKETVTLATITLQNYFRLYKKLAGMTGTAATEAEEFFKIYKLEVVAMPTNKPMIRKDASDQIFKTEKGKFGAVAKEVSRLNKEGRPVLIGTVSIEKSEVLSSLLKKQGIPHQVLNAKFHEQEAAIVAQAGQPGAVTVATNMAGRGTDIILGPGVVQKGGLHIIGTERHEARRIDNQLRGRGGRQGDPGSSRFCVSLEDDIMKRFAGDRIKKVMEWAGFEEETPIENSIISKSIENAQSKIEGYNFDIRKHLVDYDDVVNKHREVTYGQRRKVLGGIDLRETMRQIVQDEIKKTLDQFAAGDPEEWDVPALLGALRIIVPLSEDYTEANLRKMNRESLEQAVLMYADALYQNRTEEFGPEMMSLLERLIMLRTMDQHWILHLTHMENLRQSIGLEAYGQRDPLVVYKKAGHEEFEAMQAKVQQDLARAIFYASIAKQPAPPPVGVASQAAPPTLGAPAQAQQPAPAARPSPEATRMLQQTPMAKAMKNMATSGSPAAVHEPVKAGDKVGRNDLCPCGSGKKYKKCHGANE